MKRWLLLAEQLLNQMIEKINQITSSLDGTIAQIQNMNNAIAQLSSKFSEETVSLNENIRLIVEILKQFRISSNEALNSLSKDFNDKLKDIWEKKSIEAILKEEKEAIELIKKGEQTISNNLYFAQLLSIIQSIKEETNRLLGGG